MGRQAEVSAPAASRRSLWSYVVGFLLSLELTIAAYFLVTNEALSRPSLLAAIVGLAISQLLVQLVFFVHLGREPKPHRNLTVLLFSAMVLVILVFGTLWIMNNLSYDKATPQQTEQYLLQQEALDR